MLFDDTNPGAGTSWCAGKELMIHLVLTRPLTLISLESLKAIGFAYFAS
jgi:hypothetical protein